MYLKLRITKIEQRVRKGHTRIEKMESWIIRIALKSSAIEIWLMKKDTLIELRSCSKIMTNRNLREKNVPDKDENSVSPNFIEKLFDRFFKDQAS